MLFRKAKKEILEWIDKGEMALLVEGARQVGKTYLLDECLLESGIPYRKIDLVEEPDLARRLSLACSKNARAVIESLSFRLPRGEDGQAKPIIFIDEVQECPELITMSKYLVQDGRCRYVFSGSLLGIALSNIRSFPVGYMKPLTMYPLDFEEFAINEGWNDDSLRKLRECYEGELPVPSFLHEMAMELFRRYLLIGGMPASCAAYFSSHDVKKAMDVGKAIIELYKKDFTKRRKGNPLSLTLIYDLIPRRLLQESRRFVVSDLPSGNGNGYLDFEKDLYWLYKSGAIIPAYNATSPSIPYEDSSSNRLPKLFYNDVGLLSSRYEESFAMGLLSNESGMNLGGIYENFVASMLFASSSSSPLYYFKQRKLGEIDFLCSWKGRNTAIEVKSGNYYHSHPSLSKMMGVDNYGLKKAFVLCNGNIEKMEEVTYLPIYMAGYIR